MITALNLELKENATDKTIPKVVGIGDLIGQYQIETFELEYPPVNISGDVFNETWSVTAEQYKDTLVILRGTGDITTLDFTFDDCNATHPEICSYGYLRADSYA